MRRTRKGWMTIRRQRLSGAIETFWGAFCILMMFIVLIRPLADFALDLFLILLFGIGSTIYFWNAIDKEKKFVTVWEPEDGHEN